VKFLCAARSPLGWGDSLWVATGSCYRASCALLLCTCGYSCARADFLVFARTEACVPTRGGQEKALGSARFYRVRKTVSRVLTGKYFFGQFGTDDLGSERWRVYGIQGLTCDVDTYQKRASVLGVRTAQPNRKGPPWTPFSRSSASPISLSTASLGPTSPSQ
jgi:hypothetical protein